MKYHIVFEMTDLPRAVVLLQDVHIVKADALHVIIDACTATRIRLTEARIPYKFVDDGE